MEDNYIFSKQHCTHWEKNPSRNPKTGRKIDPKAEFGVYKMLEKQCKENSVSKSSTNSPNSKKKTRESKEKKEMKPISDQVFHTTKTFKSNSGNTVRRENVITGPNFRQVRVVMVHNPMMKHYDNFDKHGTHNTHGKHSNDLNGSYQSNQSNKSMKSLTSKKSKSSKTSNK